MPCCYCIQCMMLVLLDSIPNCLYCYINFAFLRSAIMLPCTLHLSFVNAKLSSYNALLHSSFCQYPFLHLTRSDLGPRSWTLAYQGKDMWPNPSTYFAEYYNMWHAKPFFHNSEIIYLELLSYLDDFFSKAMNCNIIDTCTCSSIVTKKGGNILLDAKMMDSLAFISIWYLYMCNQM